MKAATLLFLPLLGLSCDAFSPRVFLPQRGGARGDALKRINTPNILDASILPAAAPSRSSLYEKYTDLLLTKPLQTKMITSAVISGLGDYLSQALAAGSLVFQLDYKRLLAFAATGGLWLAPFIVFWFAKLESLPTSEGSTADSGTILGRLKGASSMVVVDQIVGSPIANGGYVLVYAWTGALLAGGQPIAAFFQAVHHLRNLFLPTLLASYRIWPAANMINFAFVPKHLRMLYLNLVGLFWNVILSTLNA
ncbi:unnamed protein product [Chrysoparadoxa australica]